MEDDASSTLLLVAGAGGGVGKLHIFLIYSFVYLLVSLVLVADFFNGDCGNVTGGNGGGEVGQSVSILKGYCLMYKGNRF